MATLMKAVGLTIESTDKVFITISLPTKDTKVNGLMVKSQVLVNTTSATMTDTKVNG